MIISRSICVAANGIISFFFYDEYASVYKICKFLGLSKMNTNVLLLLENPIILHYQYTLHLKIFFPHLPISPLTSTLLLFLQVFVEALLPPGSSG